MKRIVLCVIACSLVAYIGCGKKAEEKVLEKIIEKESGGKADVDISDESISIKTDDGEAQFHAGENVKLPEDFPKDIFVYKNADVKMTMEVPQGKSVIFLTKDGVSKVTEAYKKEMAGKGWKKEMAMDMGEQTSLIFKKNKRMAQILIGKEDDKTMINIIAASE